MNIRKTGQKAGQSILHVLRKRAGKAAGKNNEMPENRTAAEICAENTLPECSAENRKGADLPETEKCGMVGTSADNAGLKEADAETTGLITVDTGKEIKITGSEDSESDGESVEISSGNSRKNGNTEISDVRSAGSVLPPEVETEQNGWIRRLRKSRKSKKSKGVKDPVEAALSETVLGEIRNAAEEKAKEKAAEGLDAASRAVSTPVTRFFRMFRTLLWVFFIIWALFTFVIGLKMAPNEDMSPAIEPGDILLYYRIDDHVSARDVIVIKKNGTDYVGRVVAKSGDTVDITDEGELVVNGNTQIEEYATGSTDRYEGFVEYPLKLENDECFVLSDRRAGGEDSRYYGTVRKHEIAGTVISLYRRSGF